jgi:hypothetical protein
MLLSKIASDQQDSNTLNTEPGKTKTPLSIVTKPSGVTQAAAVTS